MTDKEDVVRQLNEAEDHMEKIVENSHEFVNLLQQLLEDKLVKIIIINHNLLLFSLMLFLYLFF